MDIEKIITWIISAVVALATSSTAGGVVSGMITNFKLKRLDPNIIANMVLSKMENTTLKVAAADTIKDLITPVTEKVNNAIDKINALAEVVIAQSKIITALASVYDKSELLTAAQRSNLINGATELNEIALNNFKKATTVTISEIKEAKMAIKKDTKQETKAEIKNGISMG